MSLEKMLAGQLELCVQSYGTDPRTLEGEKRADYIMRTILALQVELTESLNEVVWKPWATVERGGWASQSRYMNELVDVLHFLLQLMLVAGSDQDGPLEMSALATYVEALYDAKRETNAQRQVEGYTRTKTLVTEPAAPTSSVAVSGSAKVMPHRYVDKSGICGTCRLTPGNPLHVERCEHGAYRWVCSHSVCLAAAVAQKTYGQVAKTEA